MKYLRLSGIESCNVRDAAQYQGPNERVSASMKEPEIYNYIYTTISIQLTADEHTRTVTSERLSRGGSTHLRRVDARRKLLERHGHWRRRLVLPVVKVHLGILVDCDRRLLLSGLRPRWWGHNRFRHSNIDLHSAIRKPRACTQECCLDQNGS